MKHLRNSNNDDKTGTNLTRPIMQQQMPVAKQVVMADMTGTGNLLMQKEEHGASRQRNSFES